ncbi:hypothetical protein HpHCM43_08590 [Helicobacter pylori]|nr:hypothetical protein VN0271_06360 [Helicobacter pylori]
MRQNNKTKKASTSLKKSRKRYENKNSDPYNAHAQNRTETAYKRA